MVIIMNECVCLGLCKRLNKDQENFICFNPVYFLDDGECDQYTADRHKKRRVVNFKPDKEFVQQEIIKNKERKKRGRPRKNKIEA